MWFVFFDTASPGKKEGRVHYVEATWEGGDGRAGNCAYTAANNSHHLKVSRFPYFPSSIGGSSYVPNFSVFPMVLASLIRNRRARPLPLPSPRPPPGGVGVMGTYRGETSNRSWKLVEVKEWTTFWFR